MIELEGFRFGAEDKRERSGPQEQALGPWKSEGENVLARALRFPARGVWYIWLKVRCDGPWPALLTWDLDGRQPLLSARKDILVQPSPSAGWVTWTRFPGFRIEVNVDEPGEHTLRFTLKEGKVEIEKIILTLYFSAKLSGDDTLDMTGDPGGGRIEFPHGDLKIDGFKNDFRSPVVAASGSTYYVDSEGGDDSRTGTSPEEAWKTAGRVNFHPAFAPGDAILLRRGCRFNGGLAPKGNGTAKAPVTIGAYGEGDRPLLRGIGQPGIALTSQSHWVIQDLAVTSDPEYGQSAIALKAAEGSPRPRSARIINCLAFDSGSHGIEVGGPPGWDGVVVENCLSFCNSGDGICIYGSTAKGSARNAVVRGSTCLLYTSDAADE